MGGISAHFKEISVQRCFVRRWAFVRRTVGFQFDYTTWEPEYRTGNPPFDGSEPLNGGPLGAFGPN